MKGDSTSRNSPSCFNQPNWTVIQRIQWQWTVVTISQVHLKEHLKNNLTWHHFISNHYCIWHVIWKRGWPLHNSWSHNSRTCNKFCLQQIKIQIAKPLVVNRESKQTVRAVHVMTLFCLQFSFIRVHLCLALAALLLERGERRGKSMVKGKSGCSDAPIHGATKTYQTNSWSQGGTRTFKNTDLLLLSFVRCPGSFDPIQHLTSVMAQDSHWKSEIWECQRLMLWRHNAVLF